MGEGITRGDQTACGNQFSVSTMWIPGIELGSSDLPAEAFTHWAVSLAQNKTFLMVTCTHLDVMSLFSWVLFAPFVTAFPITVLTVCGGAVHSGMTKHSSQFRPAEMAPQSSWGPRQGGDTPFR